MGEPENRFDKVATELLLGILAAACGFPIITAPFSLLVPVLGLNIVTPCWLLSLWLAASLYGAWRQRLSGTVNKIVIVTKNMEIVIDGDEERVKEE